MGFQVKKLSDKVLNCGEGPVWMPKSNKLVWSESSGVGIYEYNHMDGRVEVVSATLHAASSALHADGGLIIGNHHGFHHLSQDGEYRTIATQSVEGKVDKINDVIADPKGRVFGGQARFDDSDGYSLGYLFRVDLDGSVRIVEQGLHLSNGMGFSPDLSTFYLVDTIPREIYAYDYSESDGSISNRKILVKLDPSEGLPDGLTVDSEGFIWVARFLGCGLSRFDPKGKLERNIKLPFAQPTSLTFGGMDYSELFVTSAGEYWETDLAPAGHDYKLARGGHLVCLNQLQITGRAEFLARI